MEPLSRLPLLLLLLLPLTEAILFVQSNEWRSFEELNGLWTFVREPTNSVGVGLMNQWWMRDLRQLPNATVMPVPSAFNDVGVDAELRDHVGWVWYQRLLYSPSSDAQLRTFLRFSSVNYLAKVWVNGREVGSHVGGHLPFEFEVSAVLRPGKQNRITVAVNNTLSWATIPQGDFNYVQKAQGGMTQYPTGFFKSVGNFDFFHYAGILRPVYITKKPRDHIEDISVQADHKGALSYTVKVNASSASEVFDGTKEVFASRGLEGKGVVGGAKPWWPRGMGQPFLYTFQVELVNPLTDSVKDAYRLEFGFRSVSWDQDQILFNGRPFYCLGFGMHEDSDVCDTFSFETSQIRGRGFDAVIMTKDLNLLEWMGGNCYRTSHYPYSEERQLENDRRGIAIITETPAVGLKGFPKDNLELHKQILTEMIERDRNHPSTFMWSLANEPQSQKKEARDYFKVLIDLAHSLDPTRPVTIVFGPSNYNNDQTVSPYTQIKLKKADLLDVLGVNRYYGWYIDMGYLNTINSSVIYDLTLWKRNFKKPILVTEYGADSLAGLVEEPSVDFSVQYQDDLVKRTHDAFDVLRRNKVICGEMIWNFADFMTAQSTTRAVGNHKGVFTRARQPKMAAYTLRNRYLALLHQRR